MVKLCRLEDLAEGSARGFSVPGLKEKVILVHKDGNVFGYLDSCPHYDGGTPMAWKRDAYLDGDGEYIACHSHGALFEIESGECVLGPCMGQALTRVAININDNGEIDVAIENCREEIA